MPGKAETLRGSSMGTKSGKKENSLRVDIIHIEVIKITAAKNRSRLILLFVLSDITIILRPNSSKSSLLNINPTPVDDLLYWVQIFCTQYLFQISIFSVECSHQYNEL